MSQCPHILLYLHVPRVMSLPIPCPYNPMSPMMPLSHCSHLPPNPHVLMCLPCPPVSPISSHVPHVPHIVPCPSCPPYPSMYPHTHPCPMSPYVPHTFPCPPCPCPYSPGLRGRVARPIPSTSPAALKIPATLGPPPGLHPKSLLPKTAFTWKAWGESPHVPSMSPTYSQGPISTRNHQSVPRV